jgi:GDP-L-fucose synthase
MKILVLGGNGFIGKNMVTALRRSYNTVISISLRTGIDLRDYLLTRKIFSEITPDYVINCAAHVGSVHYISTYAADVLHDNMQMILNIYKAIKEVSPKSKVINPLSNCSYPGESEIQYESDWWKGEVHSSVYSFGNAKRFIYVVAFCYLGQYGTKTLNFLVPNTFGPGDHTDPNKTHALNGMIIRMIKAQDEGEKEFEIWGTGNPIREWAYIDDVIEILKRALLIQEEITYPINIAQKKGYSIKESAEIIANLIGFKGNLTFNTKYQDGAPCKVLDNGRFQQLFPEYRFVDHEAAIKKTIEYYKYLLKGDLK